MFRRLLIDFGEHLILSPDPAATALRGRCEEEKKKRVISVQYSVVSGERRRSKYSVISIQ
jgi:hypothetical protein